MADPVFVMRLVGASLVALALLLGTGGGIRGNTAPLTHPAVHALKGSLSGPLTSPLAGK